LPVDRLPWRGKLRLLVASNRRIVVNAIHFWVSDSHGGEFPGF
jgi:hypothetical protein